MLNQELTRIIRGAGSLAVVATMAFVSSTTWADEEAKVPIDLEADLGGDESPR